MISLVTNIDSLNAQHNLNIDNEFQSKTIQQLTSGYRINSSGDDAAGLAIANGYRSSISELTQGVMNANDGISQLQIVDGGLNNISTILDRLKTLATESASTAFTGSRATLNQEYSELLTEITRQASNVNLNRGGAFNSVLSVYIGGATNLPNSTVAVDLSGPGGAVDAQSLSLTNTTVDAGGGVGIQGNTERLDLQGTTLVKGTPGVDDQAFTFHLFSGGAAQTVTATVAASTAGSSLKDVLTSLNSQLNQYGIDASSDNNGTLQFSGSTAFTVNDPGTSTGTSLLTNESTIAGADVFSSPAANDTLTLTNAAGSTTVVTFAGGESVSDALKKINAQSNALGIYAITNSQGTGINLVSAEGAFSAANSGPEGIFGAAAAATVNSAIGGGSDNTANFSIDGATTFVTQTGNEALEFQTGNGNATVNLAAGDTLATAISKINARTSSLGLYAVLNAAGTGISMQSTTSFTLTDSTATAGKGFYGAGATTNPASVTALTPATLVTSNATSAIAAINSAIQTLGLVQGRVGAGENLMQYAVTLAQSQISSYSAAQSQIRDADVAAQAANLTKAQVLTQTSVAALAQANAEPQSVLKLLQG